MTKIMTVRILAEFTEEDSFPMYLQHMSNFYLLEHAVPDARVLPCISNPKATGLLVYPEKRYNVYTTEGYRAYLESLQANIESAKEVPTDSHASNPNFGAIQPEDIVAGREEALAAIGSQLAALPSAPAGDGSKVETKPSTTSALKRK